MTRNTQLLEYRLITKSKKQGTNSILDAIRKHTYLTRLYRTEQSVHGMDCIHYRFNQIESESVTNYYLHFHYWVLNPSSATVPSTVFYAGLGSLIPHAMRSWRKHNALALYLLLTEWTE
jgi:hypothetical protein